MATKCDCDRELGRAHYHWCASIQRVKPLEKVTLATDSPVVSPSPREGDGATGPTTVCMYCNAPVCDHMIQKCDDLVTAQREVRRLVKENASLLARLERLEGALRKLIRDYDMAIERQYGGSRWEQARKDDIQYARAALSGGGKL